MNAPNNCYGNTGGGEKDCFNTPLDSEGFSILTGETKGDAEETRHFTLEALETYKITYA